jgi:hypothetical protein
MTLAKLVEEFVTGMGWEDELNTEEKYDTEIGYRVITQIPLTIENQIFRLYIDAIEASEWLMITIYPPYRVNEGKYVDACMLFNYFNCFYSYGGRISVEDNGAIRYRQIIDVSETEPSKRLIHNMLVSGIEMFEDNAENIASVALTTKTYEAIREDIEKKAAIQKARTDEKFNRGDAVV